MYACLKKLRRDTRVLEIDRFILLEDISTLSKLLIPRSRGHSVPNIKVERKRFIANAAVACQLFSSPFVAVILPGARLFCYR